MFKKLVIAGASAALIMGMAIPAFARDDHRSSGTSNHAYVRTTVDTTADTGMNTISGGAVTSGYINTGTANSHTLVGNLVNTNVNTSSAHNSAYVKNHVDTGAYTGGNTIAGGYVGGGTITTGQANAGTAVVNVVNTNLSFHH